MSVAVDHRPVARWCSSTISISTCGTPSGAARSGRPTPMPPWPAWIWGLNGHEWARRQLAKGGVGYTALDNGFASCQDPALLQRLCDRLGPGAVIAFFWRWQRRSRVSQITSSVRSARCSLKYCLSDRRQPCAVAGERRSRSAGPRAHSLSTGRSRRTRGGPRLALDEVAGFRAVVDLVSWR
jgi:hypothetical protein